MTTGPPAAPSDIGDATAADRRVGGCAHQPHFGGADRQFLASVEARTEQPRPAVTSTYQPSYQRRVVF
jgi:hypothetical protein